MRQSHGLFRPSGAFFRLQFSAGYTINMFGFDFRQGRAAATDPSAPPHDVAQDLMVRERATTASSFDPAEISHSHQSASAPSIALAILPLAIVIAFNLYMSLFKLPGLDASYLAEEAWARHRCPQSAACGR
jgi:hypothetical protein